VAEHPSDYARAFDALQQKRAEWGVAKAGAKTDQQRADVDKRYGENVKLMEKELQDIRAAKPGQARLEESRAGKPKDAAKDKATNKETETEKDKKKDKDREPD
jgi:hypothetical protein